MYPPHEFWPSIHLERAGTTYPIVPPSEDLGAVGIYSNFGGKLADPVIWATEAIEYPAISGTNVVWLDYDGSDFEVYSNFAGQLTNNNTSDWADPYDKGPDISGTNVVWAGWDGSDYEIYSNFAGQLTNNDTDDISPAISGTNVIWLGWDGIRYEIYSNFGGQVGDDSSYVSVEFAISGTNVVWSGWDGLDSEIYVATYNPNVVPAPAGVLLGILGLATARWKLRKYA